jgi:osmoprotectant transport system substrate-binding protein
VKDVLAGLSGRIAVSDMRRMNRAVDGDRRDPADVVREFLARGAP